MKKLIIAALVICLIFTGVITYINLKQTDSTSAEPQETTVDEPVITNTAVDSAVVDYEKLFAGHNEDDVIASVGGKDVTWGDYFYWLHYNCQQAESYFSSMASYQGVVMSWNDEYEDGKTFSEIVTEDTISCIKQMIAIENSAEENQVTLSQEDKDALALQLENDIKNNCEEGATEEEFFAKIKKDAYYSRSMYERLNTINYLYQNGFTKLYGENAELVDDTAALSYLTDNGYMSSSHILLLTMDMTSGEPLDDATIAEKKAKAQEIDDELKAITDKDALLKRFAELKAEYCEDTGKTQFPDGYTFLAGEMVEEFETASKNLPEYGVSDVVETTYGYHIILRLPLDPNAVIEYSNSGTPLTARQKFANEEYGEKIQAVFDALTVEYASGFQIPNINDYVK